MTQRLIPASPGQLARSGGLPVGLTFGLFDQDLSTDLAVVVPGTNELLVYRGLSNGSLGTPVRYASGGTEPVAVVTGQFVGGMASDLAVAHRDGTITFFSGDGRGSFSQHSDTTILAADGVSGASIESITVDDFNGDGESDLAVTATDTALLLLNAGDTLNSSRIVNGRFDQGLTGWTTQINGHAATDQPGVVAGLNGFARLTENQSFLTSLQQTFSVPASPQTLSFDVGP
ncbi:MAG: VCBS repeat-containing protein [Planctomycetaceae bacterium]